MDQPEASAPVESNTPAETNDQPWKNTNVWKRGIAMLLFGFVGGLGRFLVCLIALFQFLSLLITSEPNQKLQEFGQSLNTYLYQINQFLTVNAEVYPFPMTDWPQGEPGSAENTVPAEPAEEA